MLIRPIQGRTARTTYTGLLFLVALVALIAKIYVATRVLYAGPSDIRDVLFGFPGYVRSLLEQGIYRACTDVPFDAIKAGTCAYTTRMPALPLLLVGLSDLVGTHMAAVAIAKAVLMSALLMLVLWVWAKNTIITPAIVAVIAFCLLGPQVIKHAACNDYEEGMLMELMACHAILLGVLISRPKAWGIRETSFGCAGLVVLAGLCYLTKTTLLLFLLATIAFGVLQLRSRPALAICMLVLGLLPMIAWGSFSLGNTGRWSLSSSWNGENLLRGFNSESYQIYPDISVDRIFNATQAVLIDGKVVPMGHWIVRPKFDDEWHWNDHYANLARQWALSHPKETLLFTLKKAWVVFVDVQRVPRKVSAGAEIEPYGGLAQAAGIGWMAVARILFLAFCVGAFLEAKAERSIVPLWPVGVLAAYAVPYVIVFASQRHVVPMLMYAGLCFAGTLSRVQARTLASDRPGLQAAEAQRGAEA